MLRDPPWKILLIEDSPSFQLYLTTILESTGKYLIESVLSLQEGLGIVSKNPPDLILLDLYLPDSNCADATVKIMQLAIPKVPIIVVTGDPDVTSNQMILEGAQDFIFKPDIPGHIPEFLEKVERSIFRHAVRYSFHPLKEIVVDMQRIANKLAQLNKKLIEALP